MEAYRIDRFDHGLRIVLRSSEDPRPRPMEILICRSSGSTSRPSSENKRLAPPPRATSLPPCGCRDFSANL